MLAFRQGHSVAQHLGFDPATYDVMIRRLIPRYDEMLDEVAGAIAEHVPRDAHVLDLGSGSGRMSERLVHESRLRVTLMDVDAEMLKHAERIHTMYIRRGKLVLPHRREVIAAA